VFLGARYKLSCEMTEEFGVQTEAMEEERSARVKELEDAHKVEKKVSTLKMNDIIYSNKAGLVIFPSLLLKAWTRIT